MIINSHFKPVWWLYNRHAQTLYSTCTKRFQAPIDSVERLELPDGDFIDLAWAVNGVASDRPLVILLHGLGGDVHSSYVGKLLQAFNRVGYRGVLMHFRGASHEPNRLSKAYHSGDTQDLHYFLELLQAREPETKKAVVGVSLGGNVLLKWLGETGFQELIRAAVAVSVPFQLQLVTERMNKGFSRLYQTYLLRDLRSRILKKLDLINKQLPLSKKELLSLKTLKAFDDRITAPLHGFADAEAYYCEASSRQYLKKIAHPTLIIQALDDPFMPPQAIPQSCELSDQVILELSQRGGHVGFITASEKNKNNPVYWLAQRIPDFLKDYL